MVQKLTGTVKSIQLEEVTEYAKVTGPLLSVPVRVRCQLELDNGMTAYIATVIGHHQMSGEAKTSTYKLSGTQRWAKNKALRSENGIMVQDEPELLVKEGEYIEVDGEVNEVVSRENNIYYTVKRSHFLGPVPFELAPSRRGYA